MGKGRLRLSIVRTNLCWTPRADNGPYRLQGKLVGGVVDAAGGSRRGRVARSERGRAAVRVARVVRTADRRPPDRHSRPEVGCAGRGALGARIYISPRRAA